MDISSLDKATVLAALYNAARPQGMGFLHYDPSPMAPDEAQRLLDDAIRPYFDYVKGRVLKVDLSGSELNTRSYDRDNGEGAAEQVIAALRAGDGPDNARTRAIHAYGTRAAARDTLAPAD